MQLAHVTQFVANYWKGRWDLQTLGALDTMGAVPIVDFARLLENPTEDDYLAVAEDDRHAWEEHSFMYVVNHGIPSKTVNDFRKIKVPSIPRSFSLKWRIFQIESAFSQSLKFFQLPDAVKDVYTIDSKTFRGYNRQGKEM